MNNVETDDKLPEPLTPPECDLRDFRFMPLEVDRLQRSKQWRIAKRRPEIGFYALNLWAASWREVPAASLEDDDDALADAAMCSPENWPAVREDCLRGWIRCSDGRLYHPVVAAKALEAWIEKLERRKRSDQGNSKKYNREFDPKPHDEAIKTAEKMLARVLPGGEVFPNGSHKEPGGTPQGSQGTGKGRDREVKGRDSDETTRACAQERRPRIDLAWLRVRMDETLDRIECNRTTAGFANWAPLLALLDPPVGEPCAWETDVLPAIEATAASCAAAGDPLRSWTAPSITRLAIQNRNRRLSGLPPVAAPTGRNGKSAPRELEIPDWMQRLATGGAV